MKNLFSILFLGFIALAIGGVEYAPFVGVGLVALSFVMPKGVLLTTIPVNDVRSVFTSTMIAVYRQEISVMSFLRSFFPATEAMTKEISIEVQQGTELVAVDVERGASGNRNKMTLSTQKIFLPPYYNEVMTNNEHRLYDVAIGTQDTSVMATLTQELAKELMELQKKIERRYELQCAQVLETGIVTLVNGDNINFNRKAASLVDVSGSNPWTTGSNNPITDLENGAKFLREIGKASGGTFNAICGGEALNALLSNSTFQARADIKSFNMDDIRRPEMTNGATYHGQVTAGSYKVNLWAYPEVYEERDSSGTITQSNYVNPKKVIMLPENPNFKLSFAAVPNLLGQPPQQGAFLVKDWIDEEKTAHFTAIRSAGVAVPVAVNQIYTFQPVA